MVLRVVVIILASYFLGNLNGAILISRLLAHDDVRRHGSGNAGFTNFCRNYGSLSGLLVFAIDALKAVAAWRFGAGLADTAGLRIGRCGTGRSVCGHRARFPRHPGLPWRQGHCVRLRQRHDAGLAGGAVRACRIYGCLFLHMVCFPQLHCRRPGSGHRLCRPGTLTTASLW